MVLVMLGFQVNRTLQCFEWKKNNFSALGAESANKDIENFQMSVSLIFQFKESQFLLRIVAEYIGDVIFVWSAPQKLQKKGSVKIFVTGDDRKEPLRYKEPLLHTVIHFDAQKWPMDCEYFYTVWSHRVKIILRIQQKIDEKAQTTKFTTYFCKGKTPL